MKNWTSTLLVLITIAPISAMGAQNGPLPGSAKDMLPNPFHEYPLPDFDSLNIQELIAPAKKNIRLPVQDALSPSIVDVETRTAKYDDICTGSLISARLVLTARHCIENALSVDVYIRKNSEIRRARVSSIRTPDLPAITNNMKDENDEPVPDFKHRPNELVSKDYAILVLENAVNDVEPLPLLPKNKDIYEVTRKEFWLDLRGFPEDLSFYDSNFPILIANLSRCALKFLLQRDKVVYASCFIASGNSGGPLMVQLPDGRSYIIGVASISGGHISGFVNVTEPSIRKWIDATIIEFE